MDELNESLKKLTSQFANLKDVDTIKVALAGGYVLLKGSQEKAPVDKGLLRANSEVVPAGEGAEMRFNQEYAIYQEFGTSKMQANPYVRPTIDEQGDEIIAAMKNEVQNQIKGRIK